MEREIIFMMIGDLSTALAPVSSCFFVTHPQRRVLVDLPLDVQSTSVRGLPSSFADEGSDPSPLVPGAYVVAGGEFEPVLARVGHVAPEGRVHVEVMAPLVSADVGFEGDVPGVVLARVPAEGAFPLGAVVIAGTRTAWSWVQVVAVDEDGWLHLRLLTAREANIAASGSPGTAQ